MRSDLPIKLALGVGLAAAFGVMFFTNSVIGIALGVAIGSALGFAVAELVDGRKRTQDW
jgi:hypothetical protein